MQYKDFLKELIGIKKSINWYFPINTKKRNKLLDKLCDDEIFNNLAFSFLEKKQKQRFMDIFVLTNNNIQDNQLYKLDLFFDEHFSHLLEEFPVKIKLIDEFVNKLYDWILIINGKVTKQSIIKLEKEFKTGNSYFWYSLIKKLFFENNYKSCVYLVNKKINMFDEKNHNYENLISLYIISMKESYNYLENKSIFDKICKYTKKVSNIKSFEYLKLFTSLECYLIKNNLSKFEETVYDNQLLINEMSIVSLLNLYELCIIAGNIKVYSLIELNLNIKDILRYENKREYYIYLLLQSLKEKKSEDFLLYMCKLKNYEFSHIKWYFKNILKSEFYKTISEIEKII